MLDRRFVTDNIDLVAKNCHQRGSTADVEKFAELDKLRRNLQADIDQLKQKSGQISKSIGKSANESEKESKKAEGRRLREEVAAIESRMSEIISESDTILQQIPNLTHPSAPIGTEDDAVEIRRGSTKTPKSLIFRTMPSSCSPI